MPRKHKFDVGTRVVFRNPVPKLYQDRTFKVLKQDKVGQDLFYITEDVETEGRHWFYEHSLKSAIPLPNHRKEVKDG